MQKASRTNLEQTEVEYQLFYFLLLFFFGVKTFFQQNFNLFLGIVFSDAIYEAYHHLIVLRKNAF